MAYTNVKTNKNKNKNKVTVKTKILSNECVGIDTMRMVLSADIEGFGAKPGQFIMVKTAEEDACDPLLRRPFGLLRWKGNLEILYKIVGRGTAWMAGRKPGTCLDIMGPMGNGFDLEAMPKKALIVAGGIGAAPLFALTEYLVCYKHSVTFFYGARNKEDLPLAKNLEEMGIKVKIGTEDGSLGKKGFVTDLLAEDLSNLKHSTLDISTLENSNSEYNGNTRGIITCGPFNMMKEVYKIARNSGLTCYVSLDRRMACGFGVCSGCVVHSKLSDKVVYKRVCSEGPVFNGDDLVWE